MSENPYKHAFEYMDPKILIDAKIFFDGKEYDMDILDYFEPRQVDHATGKINEAILHLWSLDKEQFLPVKYHTLESIEII